MNFPILLCCFPWSIFLIHFYLNHEIKIHQGGKTRVYDFNLVPYTKSLLDRIENYELELRVELNPPGRTPCLIAAFTLVRSH